MQTDFFPGQGSREEGDTNGLPSMMPFSAMQTDKMVSGAYLDDFQDPFSCISESDIFPMGEGGGKGGVAPMEGIFDLYEPPSSKTVNTEPATLKGAPFFSGIGGMLPKAPPSMFDNDSQPFGMDMIPPTPFSKPPMPSTPSQADSFNGQDDAASVMSSESGATSGASGFGLSGFMNYWRMDPTGQSKPQVVEKDLKRRQDRNLREQKRSLKITQQIVHLKGVLEEDGRRMKNSKISILVEVEDYIKELEGEIMQLSLKGQTSAGKGAGADGVSWSGQAKEKSPAKPEPQVNGVDFRTLFDSSSAPQAVTTVDGRFLQANPRFEAASGYTSEELSKLTFFNLVSLEDLESSFALVARILNNSVPDTRFTRPLVRKDGGPPKMFLSVALVREGNTAKYFQCSIIPARE